MRKRIVGLETEYGVSNLVTVDGVKIQNGGEVAKRIAIHSASDPRAFLSNGSRFYLDIGSHPEYATPECSNVFDLVAADKAGERIVDAARVRADSNLHANERPNTRVYKINTDVNGTTFGCHENYLATRDSSTEFEALTETLAPHLFSRVVFCGAGRLYANRGFVISQRAEHIETVVSGMTTGQRGAINTRDEPHSSQAFRRLHIIVGDANMSEFANVLKVGTTSLVLTLIEEGLIGQRFALLNPMRALHKISNNLSLQGKIELKDGRKLTAIELQKEYLALVEANLAGTSSECDEIIEIWRDVLERLSRGPKDARAQVDWCSKLIRMKEYAGTRGISFNHPDVALLDLAYHDISPQGFYNYLVDKGKVETIIDPSQIELRIKVPPNTRAFLRGEFIAWCIEHQVNWSVDWSFVQIKGERGSPPEFYAHLPDPFEHRHSDLERFLKT